jgi:hypothetical protein
MYNIENQLFMKYLSSILFSFLIVSAFGQNVSERKTSMSLGSQVAFFVEVPGADKKMMMKVFEELTKSYGKLKENKKAREYFMTQTRMAAGIDVYVCRYGWGVCQF